MIIPLFPLLFFSYKIYVLWYFLHVTLLLWESNLFTLLRKYNIKKLRSRHRNLIPYSLHVPFMKDLGSNYVIALCKQIAPDFRQLVIAPIEINKE